MGRALKLLVISAITLSASIVRAEAATIGTFDEPRLHLDDNSFYSPPTVTTFMTGTGEYDHTGSANGWENWSYSDTTNTTTPGFTNQYSAYAGSGVDGSRNYGVAFLSGGINDSFRVPAPVTFTTPGVVSGAYFTNTTYAALSMLNGDSFGTKKFGGASGNDPDFFELFITGIDASGNPTGTVPFFLADYQFADNSKDYIVNSWKFVDLSSLGTVKQLTFGLVSTVNNDFGMATPAYFAMDMTAPVPEPSSVALLFSGLLVMAGIARQRRMF